MSESVLALVIPVGALGRRRRVGEGGVDRPDDTTSRTIGFVVSLLGRVDDCSCCS